MDASTGSGPMRLINLRYWLCPNPVDSKRQEDTLKIDLVKRYCDIMPGEPIFTIRRMVTSSAAIRELNYMAEHYKSTWAEELSALLREAITLKKKLTEFSSHQAEKGVAAIEFHLDRLLETTLNLTHKEAVSFQKRLLKNRNSVLTFLHQPKVLPDNNGSEGIYGLVHESLRLFCYEADFTKPSGT